MTAKCCRIKLRLSFARTTLFGQKHQSLRDKLVTYFLKTFFIEEEALYSMSYIFFPRSGMTIFCLAGRQAKS